MTHPITRENFQDICREMNLRVTHLQSIEAILHYRNNKNIDSKDNEEYCYEKLLKWLNAKIEIMPPADKSKPRNALSVRKKSTALPNISMHRPAPARQLLK